MPKKVGVAKMAKKRVTCEGCASIIEYVKNEIVSQSYKDIDGTTDMSHHITCPECHKPIYVNMWY
jgi:uncharacterized protein with PIN domain